MKKQLLCLVLAMALCLVLLPSSGITALADGAGGDNSPTLAPILSPTPQSMPMLGRDDFPAPMPEGTSTVGLLSTPLLNSYNGHIYRLYDQSMPWSEAREFCEKLGGHLVTITSFDEQNFIDSLLFSSASKNLYWIGLRNSDEDWSWITGESISFLNWANGEPSHSSLVHEDCVQLYGKAYGRYHVGEWNDSLNSGDSISGSFHAISNIGFICEWDSPICFDEVYTCPEGGVLSLTAIFVSEIHPMEIQWTINDENALTFSGETSSHGPSVTGEENTWWLSRQVTCNQTGTYEITITVDEKTATVPVMVVSPQDASNVFPVASGTFNNHVYELYDISMSWTNAKRYCEKIGGYLVTITSQQEQYYVQSLIDKGDKYQYWLGASDEEYEGVWQWVTGETWDYTNWDSGKPDNFYSQDHYLQIYRLPNPHDTEAGIGSEPYKWNDTTEDNSYPEWSEFFLPESIGFICEWEIPTDSLYFASPSYSCQEGETLTLTADYVSETRITEFQWIRSDEDALTFSTETNMLDPDDTGVKNTWRLSRQITCNQAGSYEIALTVNGITATTKLEITPSGSGSGGEAPGGSGGTSGESTVPENQYCIHVMDENGKPLENAEAVWNDGRDSYTLHTNAEGNVYFAAYSAGTPTITVSKSGYLSWTNANSNWAKKKSRYEEVTLYPESSGSYRLLYALYSNHSSMASPTDLLTRTKKLNLKNDGNLIGDLDFGEFYLDCKASGSVSRYELWQNKKKIADCSDGSFGKLSVESFTKGGSCYIRVIPADGKQAEVDTPINLEFAENKVNSKAEFSWKGKAFSLKIKDEIPFIGGSTIKFDLPINVPIVYVESEDKVKLGLNMKVKDDESAEKQIDTYLKTLERAHHYANTTLKKDNESRKNMALLKKLVQKTNKADWFKSCDFTFAAYLELSKGSETGEGYVAITMTTSVLSIEYNTVVVVVPVTVQIGVNFSVETGAKASWDVAKQEFNMNLTLNPGVSLNAFGGVGAGKLVGVGAYGSASLDARVNLFGTLSGVRSIDLTGEMGVKAYLAMLTYQRAFAHQTWHLYTANNVNSASLAAAGEPWDAGLYDASNYELDNLEYLSEESDWLGGESAALMAGEAKTAFTPLLTDTYRNAQPVMCATPDGLYAAFVRAEQDSGIRYVAVTRFDGSAWAQPVRVDATAILDSAPALCVDGSGTVWLAYARTREEPGESLVDYARTQQIVVGRIDPESLTFQEENCYSGQGYVHLPVLSSAAGTLALAWADTPVTDENSVLLPSSGTICWAQYSDSWGVASDVAAVNGPIDSLAWGQSDGEPAVAYTSQGTLYCAIPGMEPQTLATEISGHVRYGTLPGTGGPAFYWNGEEALLSSAGVVIPADGISYEFSLAGDRIYYSRADGDSANLAMLQYANGSWNPPVTLTGDSRYLENLSAARWNGSDYIFGMHTAVTITSDSVEDAKNLVWSQVMPVSDLRLDSVACDDSGLTAGAEVPVTLEVYNAGDHMVDSIDILLDGTLVKTELCELLPGKSLTVESFVVCPAVHTSFAFSVAETGEEEYSPEDNTAQLDLGYADVQAELTYRQIGTSRSLLAEVTNMGVETASGVVTFYDAEGKAVGESPFEDLNTGDTRVVEFTLGRDFAGWDGGDVSVVVSIAQDELYTLNNQARFSIMETTPALESKQYTIVFHDDDGVELSRREYTYSIDPSDTEDIPATLIFANYNERGMMLQVEVLALDSNRALPDRLDFGIASDAETCKLFFLDSDLRPLAEPVEEKIAELAG